MSRSRHQHTVRKRSKRKAVIGSGRSSEVVQQLLGTAEDDKRGWSLWTGLWGLMRGLWRCVCGLVGGVFWLIRGLFGGLFWGVRRLFFAREHKALRAMREDNAADFSTAKRGAKEVEMAKIWAKHNRVDVDVPSDTVQRMRSRRRMQRLMWASVTLVMVLLVAGVCRLWYHYALVENESYALVDLQVEADGWRGEDWVMEALTERERSSLMALDLMDLKRRLERDPGVIEANVERVLPGSLVVSLRERHAVAWLESAAQGVRPLSAQRGLLADASGHVWRPLTVRTQWSRLPVLHVRTQVALQPGQRLQDESMLGALGLLDAYASDGRFGGELSAFELRLIEDSQAAQVPPFRAEMSTFGQQQFLFSLDVLLSGTVLEQLQRLHGVLQGVAQREAEVVRLNLCMRDALPIVLRSPSGEIRGTQLATAVDGQVSESGLDRLAADIGLNALVAVDGQGDLDEEYAQRIEQAVMPMSVGGGVGKADAVNAADAAGLRTGLIRGAGVSQRLDGLVDGRSAGSRTENESAGADEVMELAGASLAAGKPAARRDKTERGGQDGDGGGGRSGEDGGGGDAGERSGGDGVRPDRDEDLRHLLSNF